MAKLINLEVENTQSVIDIIRNDMLEMMYPIGSVYISTTENNPLELFGFGEWEALPDRFLLGAGDNFTAGGTGGKSSVTLSAAIGATNSSTNALGYIAGGYTAYQASHGPTYTVYGSNSANGGTWNHATPVIEHSSTSRDVNIMPPYLVVYMWTRIA